jgi:hypothetical protein
MGKVKTLTGITIKFPEPKPTKSLDSEGIKEILKTQYKPTTSGGREYNIISRYANAIIGVINPKHNESIVITYSQIRHEWVIAILEHLYPEIKIKKDRIGNLVCENIKKPSKSVA